MTTGHWAGDRWLTEGKGWLKKFQIRVTSFVSGMLYISTSVWVLRTLLTLELTKFFVKLFLIYNFL